ncbi:hypothetical protein CDD82_4253 [Ophiocordyceps australis]|uniref:GPI mannosyltransferase 2 n=1 Tax=Ophiocordyceps australis TaxID=1399860 RepID=A0A2C5ZSX1_9HYPO|nr:hypothetical protein CDD82_4253 [Ophiocordyceps australis]
MSLALAPSRPLLSLALLFLCWKTFLLSVALGATIASDYDTSTSLFFRGLYGSVGVPSLATRLTRWDALYYVHYTRSGYVYEQEWAFGAGMPLLVTRIQALLPQSLVGEGAVAEPLLAIGLAHVSHLVAILVLYRLTLMLSGSTKLALVASALHIVSPAGLFLSSPYAESPFACLSFIGHLLFALAMENKRHQVKWALAMVSAGVVFGLATAVRSNGLSNGLLFVVGAIECFVSLLRKPSMSRAMALAAPVLGGLCVAAGSFVPQAVAWKRFCLDLAVGLQPRPWCSRTVPSIYAFVQSEYWNVGFLKYWTLNQLPLFLLASPMLSILLISGISTLQDTKGAIKWLKPGTGQDYHSFLGTLAAIQTVVALLAVSNFHVQIITRLSSGYPVWYWWVARCLADVHQSRLGRAIVAFMVMYAGVQGALFASFLPPA